MPGMGCVTGRDGEVGLRLRSGFWEKSWEVRGGARKGDGNWCGSKWRSEAGAGSSLLLDLNS